jgi:hypothetical protein
MMSNIIWAHLLGVVAVDVVSGGIREVEMGTDRVVSRVVMVVFDQHPLVNKDCWHVLNMHVSHVI